MSTNNKKLNPESPRLKRTRVGEKGLARFAADCLAEKRGIELTLNAMKKRTG